MRSTVYNYPAQVCKREGTASIVWSDKYWEKIKKIIASELEVTKELFKNEELYSFYQVGKNGIEVCSKDSTYKIRFDDYLLTYLNNSDMFYLLNQYHKLLLYQGNNSILY